jgi:hypothetical protein
MFCGKALIVGGDTHDPENSISISLDLLTLVSDGFSQQFCFEIEYFSDLGFS